MPTVSQSALTGCTWVTKPDKCLTLLLAAQVSSALPAKVPKLPEWLPRSIIATRDSGSRCDERQNASASSDNSTTSHVPLPGAPAGFSLPARVAGMLYSYQASGTVFTRSLTCADLPQM